MPEQLLFAMEVMLNGLMAGVLYALVALGFVLIFKASGIFNYAQGVMALFAALTLVGIMEGQVPFAHLINAIFGTDVHHFGWTVPSLVAIVLTLGVMILLAILVERLILKHLVNQEPISSCSWRRLGWPISWKASATSCGGRISRRSNVGLPQGISETVDEVDL